MTSTKVNKSVGRPFWGSGRSFWWSIFFQNFKIFKCSYLWPKRPQSWTKVSGDHFEGQGDHFKGQNLFKISKFSNVLIFGQNVHKVEQKCRETILRVWETNFRVNFVLKFQNFQMCLIFTKMYKKLTKSVGRPFWGSTFQIFQKG